MKQYIILCGLFVFLFSACKKKNIEPLPENNSPVFFTEGTFGTAPINLVAGDAGMSLISGVEVRNGIHYSYAQIGNAVSNMKLGIFDSKVALQNVQSSLKVGDTLYFANPFTSNLAVLSRDLFSNKDKIEKIKWFIDGVFEGDNIAFIREPGLYDICGQFYFVDGSHHEMCNSMLVGFENQAHFSIQNFISSTNDLKLWLETDMQSIDSIVWSIDDLPVGNGTVFSGQITPHKHEVMASVYHHQGSMHRKKVLIDGSMSGNFIENFDICISHNNERSWDKAIGLEMTYAGEMYSTFLMSNYKSNLVIKKADFYEINSKGQTVLKVEAEIDANLKSATSGAVKNAKFLTVFAYPVPN